MGWMAALGPMIGALSGIVTGAIQTGQAGKAAQALPEPMSFSPTPQMVKAEEMFGKRAEMGLDPAELRVARQGITRSRGVAGRMMENMGLSRISQGMSNIYGMDAEMNLAALNAKAKQDAMNRYLGVAQGFQNIQDQEVTSFNQMLNQQRMALGQAGAAGGKNILSGIGIGVQGLATNQLANAYANSGDTYNYNLGGGGPMGKMEAPVGGSNVPDPAAVSYTPQQASAMQGVGGVATDPGAYSGMPGIMQPNVINPVQTTPNVTGNQFENPFMNPVGFFPSLMMGGMANLFNPGT